MKLVVVHNAKSGSAQSSAELKALFAAINVVPEKFIAIKDGFEKTLTPFVAKGYHIAAVGGDGTISAVAGVVAGTKAVLIPLPGGTLNHFTKDLGVSQDIARAIRGLLSASLMTVDVATVNNKIYVNNSSIGLYSTSLRTRERFEDHMGKWPAAIVASIRALIRFRIYRVMIDGVEYATPFIFVGNNRYNLDGIGSTERSRLDEAILTVFIAHTTTRYGLLKMAIAAVIGKAKDTSDFYEFHPEAITIEGHRSSVSVSHDGEVSRMAMPLRYELRTGALKILIEKQ